MLGYAWTVLEPLLLASVYYFLFVMLAGNPDEFYPIWVILGVIIWGCSGGHFQVQYRLYQRMHKLFILYTFQG